MNAAANAASAAAPATAERITAGQLQPGRELVMREPAREASPGVVAMYNKIDDPMKYALEMGKYWAEATGSPLGQGPVIALTCLALRMTHIDYIRTFHTIMGKPTKRADAMLAEFRALYGGDHEVLQSTPDACEIKFIDSKGRETIGKMTKEQALDSRWPWNDPKNHDKGRKDNWLTPEDMENQLFARTTSKWIKRIQPEIVAGFLTPEEAIDIIDVEPSSVVSTAVSGTRKTVEQIIAEQSPSTPLSSMLESAAMAEKEAAAKYEAEQAAYEASEPTELGTVTDAQRRELDELVGFLDARPALDAALQRRGVNAVRSLSKEQAEEILDRLRNEARKRRGIDSPN